MTTTKPACWTNYQKISSCWIVSGHNLKAPKSETTDTFHQFHLIWRNSSWFVLFWRLPKNKSISNHFFDDLCSNDPKHEISGKIFQNMWVWFHPTNHGRRFRSKCPPMSQVLSSGPGLWHLHQWKTGMLWRLLVCMHVTYAWLYAETCIYIYIQTNAYVLYIYIMHYHYSSIFNNINNDRLSFVWLCLLIITAPNARCLTTTESTPGKLTGFSAETTC